MKNLQLLEELAEARDTIENFEELMYQIITKSPIPLEEDLYYRSIEGLATFIRNSDILLSQEEKYDNTSV